MSVVGLGFLFGFPIIHDQFSLSGHTCTVSSYLFFLRSSEVSSGDVNININPEPCVQHDSTLLIALAMSPPPPRRSPRSPVDAGVSHDVDELCASSAEKVWCRCLPAPVARIFRFLHLKHKHNTKEIPAPSPPAPDTVILNSHNQSQTHNNKKMAPIFPGILAVIIQKVWAIRTKAFDRPAKENRIVIVSDFPEFPRE
jgi:hypothetical protein